MTRILTSQEADLAILSGEAATGSARAQLPDIGSQLEPVGPLRLTGVGWPVYRQHGEWRLIVAGRLNFLVTDPRTKVILDVAFSQPTL